MAKLTVREFEENMRKIVAATPVDASESAGDAYKRVQELLSDYGKFFPYYFPKFATAKCAWFHIWIAHMLLNHPIIRFLLEWFRGCAKSVHADLGWPLFLKFNNELKCMVLVGQNQDKACKLLADIQAHLMANPRIIKDFGEQYSHGDWADGNFRTKDGCSFNALGIGQSPRGLRDGENRPDYIVVDDADSKEMSNNPKRVREAIDWIQDDLMGCFDIGRQRFIDVNNRPFETSILGGLIDEMLHAADTLLSPLKKSMFAFTGFAYQSKGYWHHLKVNAVDDFGNPTWPEKYTAQYWLDMAADKTYRSWMREYMNTPITEGKIFKSEWIKYKQILPLDEYDYLVVYADPSWKATSASDHKAVSFWGKKGNELHLIKRFVKQCSISTMVKYMYDLYESVDYHRSLATNVPYQFKMNRSVVVDFWIEANLNQDRHLDDFLNEGEVRKYQLPIRPDYRAKPDKFSRIESLSPLYERGWVYYNEAEKDDLDMVKGKQHLMAFEHGSKAPDDAPDADEGAIYYAQGRFQTKNAEHRTGTRTHKYAH